MNGSILTHKYMHVYIQIRLDRPIDTWPGIEAMLKFKESSPRNA